jgi:hypothetical protein
MKRKEEYRVYSIDIEQGTRDYRGEGDTTDEQFMEIAENSGRVYSLSEFQDLLNDEIYPSNEWIRILKV